MKTMLLRVAVMLAELTAPDAPEPPRPARITYFTTPTRDR